MHHGTVSAPVTRSMIQCTDTQQQGMRGAHRGWHPLPASSVHRCSAESVLPLHSRSLAGLCWCRACGLGTRPTQLHLCTAVLQPVVSTSTYVGHRARGVEPCSYFVVHACFKAQACGCDHEDPERAQDSVYTARGKCAAHGRAGGRHAWPPTHAGRAGSHHSTLI